MKTQWRLICTPEGKNGAWNMALDEAILISVADKVAPPTLRLYAWQPGTLSLGFAQSAADINLKNLKKENWGLVRRPTGGKAILHIDELTYSLSAPLDDHLLAGNLLESYRKISRALLSALALLNVEAAGDKTYANGPTSTTSNPICFETPSNYEITAAGKKLIGSAQARKYGGMLQHGAFPLSGDISRITRVLNYSSDVDRDIAINNLNARATNLEQLMEYVPDWQTVSEAMVAGFANTFFITFVEALPTSLEISRALELMRDKYGNDGWTYRF